jgi:hypothetical protein
MIAVGSCISGCNVRITSSYITCTGPNSGVEGTFEATFGVTTDFVALIGVASVWSGAGAAVDGGDVSQSNVLTRRTPYAKFFQLGNGFELTGHPDLHHIVGGLQIPGAFNCVLLTQLRENRIQI